MRLLLLTKVRDVAVVVVHHIDRLLIEAVDHLTDGASESLQSLKPLTQSGIGTDVGVALSSGYGNLLALLDIERVIRGTLGNAYGFTEDERVHLGILPEGCRGVRGCVANNDTGTLR